MLKEKEIKDRLKNKERPIIKLRKIQKQTQVTKIESKETQRALNFQELTNDFLAAQNIKEISKRPYRRGIEAFLSWLAAERIEQPNHKTILRFKAFLIETGLAANTVNSYLVAVKRFFSYLEGSRLYPDIAKGVKGVKQPKTHLREALTVSQVKEMLAIIDVSMVQGKRDFAMINLMARTGLRTIEIVRADVGDIKQEGGEALLYIQGKGRDSKDDFVILTDAALKPIRRYIRHRKLANQKAPLFVSLSDRNKGKRLTTKTVRESVKNYLRKINIDSPKLSAHSLRHFAITEAAKKADPLQVQAMARHTSFQTTQRYIHNLQRIKKGAERFINF